MQTKLTLRLEDDLIDKAKRHAENRGVSLSKLVASFFSALGANGNEPETEPRKYSPEIESLIGIIPEIDADRESYLDYLEKKHR